GVGDTVFRGPGGGRARHRPVRIRQDRSGAGELGSGQGVRVHRHGWAHARLGRLLRAGDQEGQLTICNVRRVGSAAYAIRVPCRYASRSAWTASAVMISPGTSTGTPGG